MGFIGQPGHPDVREAIETVKRKCMEAGLPYGIFGAGPDVLKDEIAGGCRFVLCGIDSVILTNAFSDMIMILKKK
jgi:4-hydroxy-2-oxoheptanedioate aldolase